MGLGLGRTRQLGWVRNRQLGAAECAYFTVVLLCCDASGLGDVDNRHTAHLVPGVEQVTNVAAAGACVFARGRAAKPVPPL